MTTTGLPPTSTSTGVGPDARAVDALVRRVGALLFQPDAADDGTRERTEEVVAACRAEAGRPLAVDMLVEQYGLDPFELDVVLAAVAYEIDPASPVATFQACLRFPGAHWRALEPHAPLRSAPLVRIDPTELLDGPIRIEERVLHHLRGGSGPALVDERLRPWLSPLDPALAERVITPSHRRAADDLARAMASPGHRPHVLLHGPDRSDRLAATVAAVARLRPAPAAGVWTAHADDLPTPAGERDGFVRLVRREHALGGMVLHVDVEYDTSPAARHVVERVLDALDVPVVVTASDRTALDRVDTAIELPRPDAREQAELWSGVLGHSARHHAVRLAGEFDLDRSAITHGVRVAARPGSGDAALEAARARSRAAVRHRLDGLAERIEPLARWDDLVVDATSRRLLAQLVDLAAGRTALVAAGRGQRPPGVTALFTGPSGTGKTLAAEVVAGALGLDLHRIDLASVVSKWIGETEKHLRRIFDAADQGGTLLVFDEADALFGRRSEVHDSHDRHANIEVSYLLQRMEQHRGVAVLTTNFRSAIDDAFLRRVRVLVPFSHPDRATRRGLWLRLLDPARTGVALADGIDPDRLARLDVTGGDIRSITLHATHVAAADGRPVTMDDLADAARADLTKRDRSLSELADWS